jgi:hypothetical protein
VDLYAVKACFQHRIFRGGRVQLHVFFDLLHSQRARGGGVLQPNGAWSDKRVPALLTKDFGICGAAESPELEKNGRLVCVYCIRDLR